MTFEDLASVSESFREENDENKTANIESDDRPIERSS
jgi:hypothetical protein